MDRSTCKAIVDREIEPLMRSLGVPHWNVQVAYRMSEADDDGTLHKGECVRLVDYNSACITLNPEAFEDQANLLKTLRHELYHVVLSPFDMLWHVVKRAMKDDPVKLDMLDSVFTHAVEKTAINLERMHHGLTERKPEPPRPKKTRSTG